MRKKPVTVITVVLTLVLLLMLLGGCSKSDAVPEPSEPVSDNEPVAAPEPEPEP